MVGLGSYRRASILAPTLAFVLAPSGFGQGYVIPATPASSQGVELYYGTRPVARAPLVVSVPSPAPTLHVQPPPYVVPAIAHTPAPVAPPLAIKIEVHDAQEAQGAVGIALQAIQTEARWMTSAAKRLLAQVSDRRLASEAVAKPRPSQHVVLETMPVVALEPRSPTAPAMLPQFQDVLPLAGAPADRIEPQGELPESTASVPPGAITMTQDRLISALGVAIGVAATLAFALVTVLFLRRPAPARPLELPSWVPSPAGPAPMVVSEVGLPRVAAEVAQSRPDLHEVFDEPSFQVAPRRPVESHRLRTEEAVVQFILDQNLAVLSAIGSSRSHEGSLMQDFASSVRIA